MKKLSFKLILLLMLFASVAAGQTNNYSVTKDDHVAEIWNKAIKLAGEIIVIDCHNHDLFKPKSKIWPKQTTFSMLEKGNVKGLVNCFPNNPLPDNNPYAKITGDINQMKLVLASDSVRAGLVQKSSDFMLLLKEGKKAVLAGIEYSGALAGNAELIKDYYKEGIRFFGLANGGKDTVFIKNKLTNYGKACIAEMNKAGILCDVTHLPDIVRREVIEYSKSPVIISHSNAFGVVPEPSNVSDETLELLKSKKGIICLTFFPEQVSKTSFEQRGKVQDPTKIPRATVNEFIDHVDYIKNKIGIDHIGIGSDFGGSGRMAPLELDNVEKIPALIYYLLKRGYTREEIEKIMGKNFLGFYKNVENCKSL